MRGPADGNQNAEEAATNLEDLNLPDLAQKVRALAHFATQFKRYEPQNKNINNDAISDSEEESLSDEESLADNAKTEIKDGKTEIKADVNNNNALGVPKNANKKSEILAESKQNEMTTPSATKERDRNEQRGDERRRTCNIL